MFLASFDMLFIIYCIYNSNNILIAIKSRNKKGDNIMARIGVQMMNFREVVLKEGVYNTLKKLNEMGYNVFEVSMIATTPENISEIQRAIKDFNIEIGAMSTSLTAPHPSIESLSTHFDKTVADCKALNCSILRIGILPFNIMGDEKAAIEFIKACDEQAEKLAEHGISLHFHSHHNEFVKFNGKYLINTMKDETKTLGFELDTHWIYRGGQIPQEFIKGFKDRIKVLHLKDYTIAAPDFSMFKPEEIHPGNANFVSAYHGIVHYAPVGEGSLNFKEIIDNAVDIGVKYFFIEQDDTYGRDPYECAQSSYNHIVEIGFSDLLK